MVRHTSDMGEISGLGGPDEALCQDMLEAGVQWLQDHPDATSNINVDPTGDDYKRMVAAMVEASRGEITLAQYTSVAQRLTFVARFGWDAYCAASRRAAARRRHEDQDRDRHIKTSAKR